MSAPVLLQIDFDYAGPWGADLAAAATAGGLAADIAAEPGLLWKIWTENRDEGVAGGWYVFAERPQAEAYLAKHSQRLRAFGVESVRARYFGANAALGALTRSPLV
ncbi:monooxygenase [Laribacter hongkongensis]|uniref:monooxygenase n=1 Tax=Laribacter hongkongensis TaxID=168471 RepID=UPI001EFD3136|nr:monooxygenase [Laribacter hongkongensis]MCG8995853.1 monooxygenase [Laribacter hongkongensis]MCG9010917.1 monooxygenase [Laribacter hongkongensis]MCG9024020.1 monooxygenase [Laribacter hongkongensis]MCG9047817.1 monooxygenase [Laribacter hongkongensis]MCG9074361.1 monooxygenase [Laribacter hongkongensis]